MKIPPNSTSPSRVNTSEATLAGYPEHAIMPVAVAPAGPRAFEKRNVAPAERAIESVSLPVAVRISDEVLFAQAAKGEKAALAALIERYQDFLYGLLVPLVNGDTHRAEDLFQDTFLNAIRAARTFDLRKAFRPWITAIAVNLARDDARRKKVRGEIALEGSTLEKDARHSGFDPVEPSEGPVERAERSDEEEKVRRALVRLTQLEREVVLLHFYNDLTLQETADALRSPLGTIKSRLHAALVRLSGILGPVAEFGRGAR